MAFEGLSGKLSAVFKKMRNKGKLKESDIKEAMREVRLALLEADVNYKVAKDFVAAVTEKAVGDEVLESLTPAQMVVKIVNDELTNLMGETGARLNFSSRPPTIVMMCGLQGSGKTTHSAKLALHFREQGKRPLLVACDVYRPAAIEQLKVVGEKAGVPVFDMGQGDPVEIARRAVMHAKDHGNDLVILDTAGRLHIDEALGISGVILTKLDGDTRGGAALSVRAVTGKPVKFVGTGEKLGDLEPFYPDRMASRILGMGDVLTLIEKAQSDFDAKQAAEMAQKMRQNTFNFNDMLAQMQQLKKMGPLSSVINMLPGVAGKLDDEQAEQGERELRRTEAIIQSMTPAEREKPSLINPARKRRIAAGSGTRVEDVNRLLRQNEQMQKLFRQVSGGGKKGKRRRMPFGGMPPGMGGGMPPGMPF